MKTASGQVTSIATGPGGKLFLAAANPGKLFTLGPDNEPEGTFESQPFDAHIFSRWGRMQWLGQDVAPARNASGARIDFYARSGNTSDPENNWSPWAGPYSNASGDKLDCPPARFVQWKAVLHGGSSWAGSGARLGERRIPAEKRSAGSHRDRPPRSRHPRTRDFPSRRQARHHRLPCNSACRSLRHLRSSISSAFTAASITNLGTSDRPRVLTPSRRVFRKRAIRPSLWTADDANDDQLEFAIYFRGENETAWKLLKDKLDTRFYSWDTTAMPDGAYYLKIVASDAPSNPTGEGLTSERVSDRFVVDNTPPAIVQLTAEAAGGAAAVRVRFQASDSASSIARAQYSLDAGDWTLVFPTGGLSDAPRESYDFQLQKVAPGEHTITVRVYDQFENVSSAKATVRVPASGN